MGPGHKHINICSLYNSPIHPTYTTCRDGWCENKKTHMKCNGKTFMCLFYVRHTRRVSTYKRKKKESFSYRKNKEFLRFFLKLFLIRSSRAFCRPNEKPKEKKVKIKNLPHGMKYTVGREWEFKDVYFCLSFPFCLNIHEFQIKTISVCYIVYDVWYINIFNIISTNCKVIQGFHSLFLFCFSLHLYVDMEIIDKSLINRFYFRMGIASFFRNFGKYDVKVLQ